MRTLKNLFAEFIGCILYAVGISYFITPCDIAPGGVSGVSLILNYIYDLPIGTVSFILNIPILILGYFYLNKKVILRSLRIIFISSLLLDLVAGIVAPFSGERLLGAVFGGLLVGIGIGAIFYVGGTTGGTDILSHIAKKKFPSVRIGNAILAIDCVIIIASMLVFKELESGLYGIISLFCTTKMIDAIIYGTDSGSMIMIVSDKAEEISDYITKKMERGITIWDCHGGYSLKKHSLLMCAIRIRQLSALKAAVKEIDDKAFMICMRSTDIYGEGFD